MSVVYLMVLADGETYAGLSGCKIVRVDEELAPEEHLDDLESGHIKYLLEAASMGDGVGVELEGEFYEDEGNGVLFRRNIMHDWKPLQGPDGHTAEME
jgi:hypothetical protein